MATALDYLSKATWTAKVEMNRPNLFNFSQRSTVKPTALSFISNIPKAQTFTEPVQQAQPWKMSIEQFWETIKVKYPDYADMDSKDLWEKMLVKYPQYQDIIQQDINDMWLWQEAGQRISDLWSQLWQRISNVWESLNREKSSNPLVSSAQSFWTAMWAVWGVIWWAFDVINQWIGFVTPDIIKDWLSWWAKEMWGMLSPNIQEKTINAIKTWWEVYSQFKQENPYLAETIEWGLNIASIYPIWYWSKVVKWWVEDLAKQTIKQTVKQTWKLVKWTKSFVKQIPWQIDNWAEKLAWKALWGSTGKKELFQAASPSYQTLGKDKNILNIWKNLEKADVTVLKYWFKPTNTETRAIAYKDSMKKVWSQVDEARWWTPTKTNAVTFAEEIEKFIDTKKINWKINPEHLSDIKALQWQADYFRSLWKVDVPTLWQIRADLNAMTSFKSQNPFWDVYNSWLKNIWVTIRNTENSLIESYKWTKFGNLMQEYRALAETYPDIVKANIKNMRAKWVPLEEALWRISWIWDIIKWGINIVAKGSQWVSEVWQWIWKVVLWKVYSKLKDADFLVNEWYKKLSQSLTPKTIKNVSNRNINPASVIKYSKKSAKISGQEWKIVKPSVTPKKVLKPSTPIKKVVTQEKVIKKPSTVKKEPLINKKAFINPTKIKESIKPKVIWLTEKQTKILNKMEISAKQSNTNIIDRLQWQLKELNKSLTTLKRHKTINENILEKWWKTAKTPTWNVKSSIKWVESVYTSKLDDINNKITFYEKAILDYKTVFKTINYKLLKNRLWDAIDKVAEKVWWKTNLLPTNKYQNSKTPSIIKKPTESSLINEARKYKTADEFIRSKNKNLKFENPTTSLPWNVKWDIQFNVWEDFDWIWVWQIELAKKGTWKWSEIINQLKSYADAKQKPLEFVTVVNPKFFEKFDFLKKIDDWRKVSFKYIPKITKK